MINRHARHGRRALATLYGAIVRRGLRVAAFHPVANDDEATKILRAAVRAGAPAVLVGGGDGTMMHAVNELAHAATVLGVLPLGTGNSFAQSLGIAPGDLESALDVVAGGRVECVDLGCVDGRYFANFATIGLSSAIADATPHGWKAVFGKAAYALAGVFPLLRHPSFRATIRWNGGKLALRTQDIIVANGRYFGATPLTPDATLVSGRLALFTAADGSHLGALRTYLALGRDVQTQLTDAHIVETTELEIHAKPKQSIAIDGSMLCKTPARMRVVPAALRVYVPAAGVAR